MHRYQNLTVALERTDEDAGLIRYARSIIQLGTVDEVSFVHVWPNPSGSVAADREQVLQDLREEVRLHAGAIPAAVQVDYDLLAGPLLDGLLAHVAIKHTDLLLMGHQIGPGSRKLARRLAMKAPCSVWIVPRHSPASIRRILVPIDFSETGADSMRVAVSMARLSGEAECFALHVYENRAIVTYEGYDQILRGQEEEAYQKFIAPIDCQGVRVTTLFEEGANVPHVIAKVVEQCGADLIVMATRGRSLSSSILLGSVTEEMIKEAPVPLLAVKHFGARMNVVEALLDRRFRHKGELRTD